MQLTILQRLTAQIPKLTRNMAVFTQVLNPITGINEWDTRDDDYDYHQEVANAGFGDMLHDSERNQKYYAALRKTITKLHDAGQEAHVLDIGTGTGILSMMAVTAGADSVTACEAFMPMANCAERILQANGMADKVMLIKKRSTELCIGSDMQRKANVLVTEVLDTELIGEGAIGIYNHAHDALLTDDVVCIPARATCYAQVAQSPLASQWNSLKLLTNLDGEVLLEPTPDIKQCKGEAGLHDVQLSQLPLQQFRRLTEALPIFEFDFNRKAARETMRSQHLKVSALTAGSTDLVFYWWDIKMDLEGEILLSCAPYWAHPDFAQLAKQQHNKQLPLTNAVPWRDHWMQAIYYIPQPLQLLEAQSEFVLACEHDEYSLWFDAFALQDVDAGKVKKSLPRHSCSCSLHMTYARSRIGQINQSPRNKRFMQQLEANITKDANVLLLGDGCLLGLSAAKLGAATVICHEPHRYSRRFVESLTLQNAITTAKFIEKLEDLTTDEVTQLTHIFAEPYFINAILPWDNFYYGTLLHKIKQQLAPGVKITPHAARIMALPVEFLDLHKIRTPLGSCEGFDLRLFDRMVDSSMSLAQSKVEAQPLWEYPCRALAAPQQMLLVTFDEFMTAQATEGSFSIAAAGSCNGIALWVDWLLDDSDSPKSCVSTGPCEPISVGGFIKWDMFVRQGVHLIGNAQQLQPEQSRVDWTLAFKPEIGDIKFQFDVKA